MIIDRNASVTPNRFESPWLRRTMGKRIGRAGRDDMLRALLWVSEVRMADGTAAAWREFHQELERELAEAKRRRDRLSWQRSDQIAADCYEAAKELADQLWEERQGAAEALKQCEDIAQGFSSRLGLDLFDEERALPDTRAALAVLNDHLPPARQRFNKLISDDQQVLHRLGKREERKRQSAGKPGLTIEQLDAAEQDEFDDAIRQALERSGFQASSREPRTIEVTSDGETGLVFCANVQHPACDETTDVRVILTAQRLATANGLRGVVVISNLRYISRAANMLCEGTTPSVRLMQRFELQRWVEWGVPLRNVLVTD
ncbi:hypothetical protein ACFRCI_37850 [Streptomyces sp. NPDC056638]|uniref:hypothetical protein n=1 Tax=Streptomyces sp. NPDC056638 TaxID=3345887 RepID=UPI00369768D6